jgi:cytochrome P450
MKASLDDIKNKTEQDPLVFDPRFIAMSPDPFPALKAFRESDPVHWSTKLSAWILTRYDDVRKALKVPDLSANRLQPFFEQLPQGKRSAMADLIRYLSLWASFRDPPDHSRVRGILNAAFPLKIVEDWTPRIAIIVDNLLDRMEQQSSPELIRDLGFRLPWTVIMDMLGVPASYLDEAGRWSNDIALFIGSSQNAPDKYERAQEATRRMKEMLVAIVADRRAHPQQDLLSVLIHADQGRGPLTHEEVLATCILLIVAGHETTALSIGNSVRTLLRHPEQLERLRSDPSLLSSAVEECLRFEGPVGSVGRVVAVDHEMRGKHLKSGDRVFLMIGAANRDNSAFKDPDMFDVGRTPNPHLTFGGGLHFCLGAPLARLEIKLALDKMIRRYPQMGLIDRPLEWTNTLVMRGLKALPLRLE